MLGPLFHLEMLLGARRGSQHAFRWFYAGWLLFLMFCWLVGYYFTARNNPAVGNVTSDYAGGFVRFFLYQQYILILLATPVFVAGGVTDEKSRGTLIYLLTTDLTTWQILVGKLLGRLAQVVTLLLVGLPILLAVGVFGGLTPALVVAVVISTLAPLPAVGSASLLASVWCRTTREAVISLYTLSFLGLIAYALAGSLLAAAPAGSALFDALRGSLEALDPLYVLGAAVGNANEWEELARRGLIAAGSWGVVALACLLVAGWRLRPAYTRQLENAGRSNELARVLAPRPPITEPGPGEVVESAPLLSVRGGLAVLAGVALTAVVTLALAVWVAWASMRPAPSAGELLAGWRSGGPAGLDGVVASRPFDIPALRTGFLWLGLAALSVVFLAVSVRRLGAVWTAFLWVQPYLITFWATAMAVAAVAGAAANRNPLPSAAAENGFTAAAAVGLLFGVAELTAFAAGGVGLLCRWQVRGNPVLWKEQYVEGLAPLPALRMVPHWLCVTLVFLATSALGVYYVWDSLTPSVPWPALSDAWSSEGLAGVLALVRPEGDVRKIDAKTFASYYLFQGLAVLLLATLLLGIRCSGAVSGERERQSWDNLLLVPLETRSLTSGKVWGILGASLPYLLAYAAPALVLATVTDVSTLIVTLIALGSTLLGMVFVASAGLYFSSRSRTSWRALLGTLGVSYVGGFLVFAVLSPGLLILAGILMVFMLIAINSLGLSPGVVPLGQFPFVFFITTCVGLAVLFALSAWWFLHASEQYVGQVERTRHWQRRPRLRARRVRRVVDAE